MQETELLAGEALREIIYCFQMLTQRRGGGMRLVARDHGGYELYLMQLRKNANARPQLIEYKNGQIVHSGEDADMYRFAHRLAEYVRASATQPLVYQLDAHFDQPDQRLVGDAGSLSWAIGSGAITLGKLW